METNHNTSRYTDWETVAIAIVLMATGLTLLGGNLFGILSLDRIQNLWPVALIAVGIIDLLAYEDNQDSTARIVEPKGHARQLR